MAIGHNQTVNKRSRQLHELSKCRKLSSFGPSKENGSLEVSRLYFEIGAQRKDGKADDNYPMNMAKKVGAIATADHWE